MTTAENWSGRTCLMVAHCADMVDRVALPIWVVALVVHYKFDPQQAGVLEPLWNAGVVLLAGPMLQAALVLTVALSSSFIPYAGASVFIASVMIFTHTFAFGHIARLEPDGCTLAATPAMLMAGSAIGLIL